MNYAQIKRSENPLVSIMIPTFQQKNFVLDAVRSALAQDYENLEVIVSDDGSSYNIFQLLNFIHDTRLRVYKNSKNIGRAENYRHLLFDLAEGEWVLMLDGDDYLIEPTFVRLAMSKIKEHQNIVLVGAGYTSDDGYYRRTHLTIKDDLLLEGKDVFFNWERIKIAHFSVLYRRELALTLNFYANSRRSVDSESLLQIVLCGYVVLLAKNVGVWRDHGDNESRRLNYQSFLDDLLFLDLPANLACQLGYDQRLVNIWKRRHRELQISTFFLLNLRSLYRKNLSKNYEAIKNIKQLRKDFPAKIFDWRLWRIAYSMSDVLGLDIARFIYLVIKKITTKRPKFNGIK